MVDDADLEKTCLLLRPILLLHFRPRTAYIPPRRSAVESGTVLGGIPHSVIWLLFAEWPLWAFKTVHCTALIREPKLGKRADRESQ